MSGQGVQAEDGQKHHTIFYTKNKRNKVRKIVREVYLRDDVPCGIQDRGVTSLERESERPVSRNEAQSALAHHLLDVLGASLSENAT